VRRLGHLFPRDVQEEVDGFRGWERVRADDFLPPAPDDVAGRSVPADDACTACEHQLGRLAGERIAIYGAGAHTEKILGVLQEHAHRIVGILDDAPMRQGKRIGRWSVAAFEQWRRLRPDAIVISSDAFETRMAAQAHRRTAGEVRVVTLYAANEPEQDGSAQDERIPESVADQH
jgi:hypothetical protein